MRVVQQHLTAVASLVLILFSWGTAAAARRPNVYTDRGACPFECCVYRDWDAERITPIYSSPRSGARRITMLKPGTRVQAQAGFVRTWAGRFRVQRENGKYRLGDTIWVYTYHGEGYFTVWYRGRMYKESLAFSPYGGSLGKRCEDTRFCFGELDKELRFVWWVRVRLSDGRVGWTNRASDYSNTDACG